MSPAPSAPIETITVTAPRPAAHRAGWRLLLSELNPLQYLPVVGTIYRAVTGDTIPDTVREAGSLVVSGLTGGPVGLGISLAAMAVERITGIDPEAIGERLLHEAGVGGSPPLSRPEAMLPRKNLPRSEEWTRAQLAAYGVTSGPGGELRRGGESGADVLNGLELGRLQAIA